MELLRTDLGSARVDYLTAWDLQRRIHGEVVAGDRPDTVLLLEHESVYTAGRRTSRAERPADGTEVVDVDRGGRITWHGPGQLVVYPVVALREPVDVVAYVRALEAAVIDTAGSFGVETARVPGRSGVWVLADGRGPDRKLCAVGVRVARGVTMHGIALNADADLTAFEQIIPCGITDAGVTSLTLETGRRTGVREVADVLEPALVRALDPVLAAATATVRS